jgi:hypothetical protein
MNQEQWIKRLAEAMETLAQTKYTMNVRIEQDIALLKKIRSDLKYGTIK